MTMPSDFRDSRILNEMGDLVVRLVRNVVDEPEVVTFDLLERENSAVLQLRVAEADLGMIIGPQRRTAKALRAILIAIAAKRGQTIDLEIDSISTRIAL